METPDNYFHFYRERFAEAPEREMKGARVIK
jgi:hypothetical protein